MTVEVLYWGKSSTHPAGHCSVIIDGEFVDCWLPVMDPDDDHCKMPAQIVSDRELVQFAFGLRFFAFNELRSINLNMPSGMAVYELLYTEFVKRGTVIKGYDAWDKLFAPLENYRQYIGDHIDVFKQAGIELGKFLQRWFAEQKSYAGIISRGAPLQTCQLDFINIAQAKKELAYLRRLEEDGNLIWYSKSGALCDFRLNAGEQPFILSSAGSASGMSDYERGKVRHNCASFVLFILLRSGMSERLAGFEEAGILPGMLQKMIGYNAEAEGRQPNPANVSKAGWMGVTSRSLRLFGYGPRAITEWAGTAPDVVLAMSQHARDYQESAYRRGCVIL